MSWNPSQYLQYEDARLRPALDLLARIPLDRPESVVDLGCGPGNVAQWIARRWPDAQIEGVDGDAAMLAKAREATAGDDRYRWVQSDLAAWHPVRPPELVYSNAALHWLDDHRALFPRLLQAVAARGALAVQMPDNFGAPSHRELFDLAASANWRERLGGLVRASPVAAPAAYYEWLAPSASVQDIWSTEYLQRLPAREDGEHPVVAWMKGSALIPFTTALQADERAAFVAAYAARIERAYPRRTQGEVLFPFRRVFIVATR
jgi:trans-aconitate 2-methyltransferase